MVRLASFALICLLALGLPAAPASAQAVVESAILGAASGTAAAGTKGTGAAAAGVFEALRKTLAGANQPDSKAGPVQVISPVSQKSATSTRLAAVESASPEAQLTVEPVDVSGITIGLTRQELIDKYGQPALKTAEPARDQLVETFTYMQGKNEPVMVTLRNGVVSAKTVAPKSTRQTAPVITLP
ncbi:MAG: hypothetical protein JJE04_25505 [Acidobacteriia bacterium]|nr:hypothetical protein [Terriglobia bacterium]